MITYLFQNTAKELSSKFHILKYKTLLSRLESLDKVNFFENSSQNYLEFLSKLKSIDLITNGTDFFWSLIHRLNATLDKNNKEEIEKTYVYFLLNAFDSFYLLLPFNSKVQFKGIGGNDLILPKLDLSLNCSFDSGATLSKLNNTSLNYKLDKFDSICDSNYLINLNEIPYWFRLKKELVCKKISIIFQKHGALFEDNYFEDCCDNIFLGHLFKNKIENAFGKIKLIDLSLYEKLVSSLDYIIPVGNEIKKEYSNFANVTLKKTIFLSIELLFEPEIHVAEYIIHEYSHCELHYVQDTVLFTNNKEDILEYYSPWRPDPRPLIGLIHAIFVSNEVACFFFTYLLNASRESDETLIVRKKLEILIHKIHIGLKQIKKIELTDFSLELMNVIQKSAQEISEQFSISTLMPPEEITNHILIWKSKNTNFALID